MASPAPADPRWALLLADVEDAANLASGAEIRAREPREAGTPPRLRRVRHVAAHGYPGFDVEEAAPAAAAAARVAAALPAAAEAFGRAVGLLR